MDQQPERDALLVEYQAAQDVYLHYDGFRWQAGSFLVGGVFIFWGLLIQQPLPNRVFAVGSVLVATVMALWLLFAHHYRQAYLWKLLRIHEIEEQLGLEQHRRFVRRSGAHRLFGPKGHELDMYVFAVMSAGGTCLALARNGFSWLALLPIPLIVLFTGIVLFNERRAQQARAAFLP